VKLLLDVNVLIALLDPKHIFHTDAHAWWKSAGEVNWASCPLTENAFLRILSNPRYDKRRRFSFAELATLLGDFTKDTSHEFWPDDISLLNGTVIVLDTVLGSKQLTDIYLLALAVKNKSGLVTFDERIPFSAVKNATAENVLIVPVR